MLRPTRPSQAFYGFSPYEKLKNLETEMQVNGYLSKSFNPRELNGFYDPKTGVYRGPAAQDVSAKKGGTRKARSVADVILGEAGGSTPTERLTEMLGIASVIANRAKALGITPEEVVAQDNQFHAYNKALPAGVERYRALAEQALGYVKQNGPVTTAHYFSVTGTPAPAKGLTVAQAGPATTFYDGEFGNAQPASTPKGLEALTPNGLVTDSPIATANRTGLQPGILNVRDTLAADPRFAGVEVTSGFRDPASNRRAGGAKRSQHMVGTATDFRTRDLSDEDKARFLDKALTAGARGVGIYPSGNIHLDTRASPAIWGPAGYAGSPVSSFPEWSQPMLDTLTSGNLYTPYFDVPTPTPRPTTEVVSAEESIPDLAKAVYTQEIADRVAPEPAASFGAPELAAAYGATETAPQSTAIEAINGLSPAASLGALAGSMVGSPVTSEAPMFSPPMGALLSVPPSDPQTFSTLREFQRNAIDPTAAVTMSPPSIAEAITPPTEDIFPPAPEEPSNWAKFKTAASPVVSNAMLGNTVAGLPGMAVGAALGLAPQFGLNLDLGPSFDAAVPKEDRFSTGYGLNAIGEAMGGPFGATGFSLSNPGMSYVSLGPRTGTGGVGLRRSDKYGWTEVVGPNGEVRGIKYDNPNKGGIFGSLSRALGDAFGGISDKERAEFAGKAGLF